MGIDGADSRKDQCGVLQLFCQPSPLFLWPSFFGLCLSAGGHGFVFLPDCVSLLLHLTAGTHLLLVPRISTRGIMFMQINYSFTKKWKQFSFLC